MVPIRGNMIGTRRFRRFTMRTTFPIPLLCVIVVWVFSAGSAEARSRTLSSSVSHRAAGQAVIVRDLLRVQADLTYVGAAARPPLRAVARRIRVRNRFISGLCSSIIRDDARASQAERRLRGIAPRAALYAPTDAMLREKVHAALVDAQRKLDEIGAKAEAISRSDLFDMQRLMRHFAQLSEISTSVINALNQAISSLARRVKS